MRARSKYGAKVTYVDGIRFHSKGEARRWAELKLLERGRRISVLRRQIPFALSFVRESYAGPQAIKLGTYVCDFSYLDGAGHSVYEDWKGFATPLGKWKIKHVEAQYGITIRITGPAARKRAA